VLNISDFVIKAMQLSIECFIDHPQRYHKQPMHTAILFVFDLTNGMVQARVAHFVTPLKRTPLSG
jgi:hypothetical protein